MSATATSTFAFLSDPADADETRRIAELNERLVRSAHAAGGTCTGKHGIGTGKKKYLAAERGPGMAVLAAVKRSLDPRNVMNPGKILEIDAYPAIA